jgi:hypothetical protein
MSSVSNQFYILPKEGFYLVEKWIKEFNFRVVLMQLFPDFKLLEVSHIENLEKSAIKREDIYSMCLGYPPPYLSVESRLKFLEKNPDYLTIDLGKLTNEGLKESFISGITDNTELLKIWHKLIRQLRKETSSGLWAINPIMKTKGFYKNIRFTQGAYELAKNGTKLLPAAGWNYYTIEEPDLTFQ